jgi:glucose/mannose-6-phosphate isomerase
VIELDDEPGLHALDQGDMLGSIASMGSQLREGYRLGLETEGLPTADGITSVVTCGMGGSAIAGDVIRAIFRGRLGVPVDVQRGPELPEYAGSRTLVLISSYSGNTAESISCFERALERGCRIIALASGGIIADRASIEGSAAVGIPSGKMPRAAFGWMVSAGLGALETIGLLPACAADVDEAARELDTLADRLGPSSPRLQNPAKDLAWRIADRIPVIWGAEGLGSIAASRWRTQFNENAKTPAFSSSLPELDHNEVVGWTKPAGTRFFLVALRHDAEHPDVAARFPASIQIAESAGVESEEVRAAGRSDLARIVSLVIMGDLTSVYSALLKGIDPSPIEAIVRLKQAIGT